MLRDSASYSARTASTSQSCVNVEAARQGSQVQTTAQLAKPAMLVKAANVIRPGPDHVRPAPPCSLCHNVFDRCASSLCTTCVHHCS